MIDVKDEILESEARYRIRDNHGNILYDNLIIEQITPVIQQGTPQNKVLYDSIKSGNDLVQKFNVPIVTKMFDNYNYLAINNSINQYEKGMRVLLNISDKAYGTFETSLIPAFSEGETNKNGFEINTSLKPYQIFDKDDNTFFSYNFVDSDKNIITFPVLIKPKRIKFKFNAYLQFASNSMNYMLKGVTETGETIVIYEENFEGIVNEIVTREVDVNINSFLKSLMVRTKSSISTNQNRDIYEIDIISGESAIYNPSINSYLNINNLGEVLIDTPLAINTNYELVYDGTMFIAKEV